MGSRLRRHPTPSTHPPRRRTRQGPSPWRRAATSCEIHRHRRSALTAAGAIEACRTAVERSVSTCRADGRSEPTKCRAGGGASRWTFRVGLTYEALLSATGPVGTNERYPATVVGHRGQGEPLPTGRGPAMGEILDRYLSHRVETDANCPSTSRTPAGAARPLRPAAARRHPNGSLRPQPPTHRASSHRGACTHPFVTMRSSTPKRSRLTAAKHGRSRSGIFSPMTSPQRRPAPRPHSYGRKGRCR